MSAGSPWRGMGEGGGHKDSVCYTGSEEKYGSQLWKEETEGKVIQAEGEHTRKHRGTKGRVTSTV